MIALSSRKHRTVPGGCSPSFHRWFLATLACLSALTAGCIQPAAVVQPSGSHFYASRDYVVYRLESAETPAHLAQRFLGDPRKAWWVEEANPGARFESGRTIVIPLRPQNMGGVYANGYQTVPILTYHRFADACQAPLCMPTAVFREQMRYLKENGYHAITPEDLLAFLEYRQPLPQKSILITIDDGYRSVYDIAYPVLRQVGFPATLFIYTELIDVAPVALTWNQLAEMKRNGFSIGSHTIYHSDLTQPKEGESGSEYAARIDKELSGSKQILDRKMNQETWILAYPYGNHDQKVVASAQQAGYKLAVSVKRGGNPFFANALTLRRDQILERDMPTFVKRLKTFTPIPLE
jgi:peptidoglycan/xylan/chitin deacetylase (PgdA/CDA1 family)